jgi:sec-independent protein translocase protein TatC
MATRLIPPRLRGRKQPKINPPPAPAAPDGEAAMMGFFDHLEELRQHLYRAVLGLAAGMIFALFFANNMIDYIAASAKVSGIELQAISPTETVAVYFRVVLMMGAILVSPWITYQLLSFITPGLTRREKGALWQAIPLTTLLFIGGVLITWFLLMPAYIGWLAGFNAQTIKPIWTAENYFAFVTQALFWHGVAFESPVIFFVLAKIGLITANQMLKYWRHAMVGAAAFAGFVAPTYDPLTMIIVTFLLFGLYMASVGLVIIGVPGSYTRKKVQPQKAR